MRGEDRFYGKIKAFQVAVLIKNRYKTLSPMQVLQLERDNFSAFKMKPRHVALQPFQDNFTV